MHMRVVVNDRMQRNYVYDRTEPIGRNLAADFQPQLTPREMLQLGVFGGRYMTDCRREFPASWFTHAKLCSTHHDPKLNYFGVNASQSLATWWRNGWIRPQDPRGWFQWYCRYYMGRRSADDARQIRRWGGPAPPRGPIVNNNGTGDHDCRPRQRQAVLHWAYDSRKF
jgi:hypothetical protein